jgi:hypothetical protein
VSRVHGASFKNKPCTVTVRDALVWGRSETYGILECRLASAGAPVSTCIGTGAKEALWVFDWSRLAHWQERLLIAVFVLWWA